MYILYLTKIFNELGGYYTIIIPTRIFTLKVSICNPLMTATASAAISNFLLPIYGKTTYYI